jgi:DNA-binding phage protein
MCREFSSRTREFVPERHESHKRVARVAVGRGVNDPIAAVALAQIQRRRQTITYVADVAGVDRSVLSKWLGGRRKTMRLADIAAVMRVLGIVVVPREDLADAHRTLRPGSPPPRRPAR